MSAVVRGVVPRSIHHRLYRRTPQAHGVCSIRHCQRISEQRMAIKNLGQSIPSARRLRRSLCRSIRLTARVRRATILVVGVFAPLLNAASTTRPARVADPIARERLRWQSVIDFFGEEDTGKWSLRVNDKNVRERATFQYLELWTYDRTAKA